MTKPRMEIELAVPGEDDPEMLPKVLRVIVDRGVNVLAHYTALEGDRLKILLIAENAAEAKIALEEAGFKCTASSVVLITTANQLGAAAEVGQRLSRAGIGIQRAYAPASQTSEFFTIFKTGDDERALRVLAATDVAQAA